MAGKFKIVLLFCLVASCLAQFEIAKEVPTTTSAPPTTSEITSTTPTAAEITTPTAAEITTPTAAEITTPTAAETTRTTAAEITTTTAAATTITTEAGGTTTTTTEAGGTTTTTTEAGGTTTTTTEAGGTTTTTTEAGGTTTTEAGGTTTTTTEAGGTTTTTTEAGGTGDTTTQSSGGTTTGGTTTKPQATTESSENPCASNPCVSGSTCEARHDNSFVCRCLAGDTYNNDTKICEKAKVFPGELSLTGMKYDEKMSDKRSQEFKDASDKIVAEVTKVFEPNKEFSEATVLKLQSLKTRVTGVKATVEIIFQADAKIDDNAVTEAIDAAAECKDCLLAGATFQNTSLCASKPCDEKSTTCSSTDGTFTCTCNEGYIQTNFSTRVCTACPSGQGEKDGVCVVCSFGYSGFNCKESWKLVLTIVGTILGGLLLVTLILLPVVALKSPKKSSKKGKEADIGMSQVNQPNTKAPMITSNFSNGSKEPANGPANGFANTGMQRFPRATTNNNWESRTNLDMTPSNSRQNLIPASRTSRYDDDDDAAPYAQVRPQGGLYSQARPESNPYAQTRPQSNPYAQTRPQSNPYAQTRPQSNPYAQTRPQGNPYASSQGQSSPYFAEDVGRRY